MKTLSVLTALLAMSSSTLWAQNTAAEQNTSSATSSGDTKFILTGYGFSGMEIEGKGDKQKTVFGETGFSPILIWKISKNVFFESEMEMGLTETGETELGLEYANVQWLMNKYMTLRVGKFLTPFGTFGERMHPAWINKMVEKPLGFSDEGVMAGPMQEVGFDLRGGIPLGSAKMNYSVYVSNGPKLITGADPTQAMMAGQLMYANAVNEKNKAMGGRIGLLPFTNSSFEIGISYQKAQIGNGDTLSYYDKGANTTKSLTYGNLGAQSYAVDFSYVKSLDFLKGTIDIKGQLNNVTVDKTDYASAMDSMKYSFDNVTQAYYAQLAYRPTMVKALKKFELVGRYSAITGPEKSKWGEEEKWVTVGLNYWLSWRTVIKFNYQMEKVDDKDAEPVYLLRFATGF